MPYAAGIRIRAIPTRWRIPGSIKMLFLGISVAFLVGFRVLRLLDHQQAAERGLPDRHRQRDEEGQLDHKGELIGSTRVVVLFLFFIAIFLFCVDTCLPRSSTSSKCLFRELNVLQWPRDLSVVMGPLSVAKGKSDDKSAAIDNGPLTTDN